MFNPVLNSQGNLTRFCFSFTPSSSFFFYPSFFLPLTVKFAQFWQLDTGEGMSIQASPCERQATSDTDKRTRRSQRDTLLTQLFHSIKAYTLTNRCSIIQTYIHTYICIYIYIYIYAYIYAYMHTYNTYMCLRMCVSPYVCMCVCERERERERESEKRLLYTHIYNWNIKTETN